MATGDDLANIEVEPNARRSRTGTENNDQMRRDGQYVQASLVKQDAQANRDGLNNQRQGLSD